MKLHNSREPGSAINALMPLDVAADLIRSGLHLAVAGREAALDQLPVGNWIGGTTPYFMDAGSGVVADAGSVFVTDISVLDGVSLTSFGAEDLEQISAQCPDHGFAMTIIPFGSTCHNRFAAEAPHYPQAFLKPTVGWIAGYDLDDADARAYVYDGRDGSKYEDRAVVAYASLADDVLFTLDILNIFTPDTGDTIRFAKTGNLQSQCIVNGVETDFAAYIRAQGRDDGALPLIGDFGGAHINASIQSIDAEATVHLYAPVFPGVDYHFAAPVGDYADAFRTALDGRADQNILWSCNCILNFMFGSLEGQHVGAVAGPVTFGEIAYQLVNQTMVMIRQV